MQKKLLFTLLFAIIFINFSNSQVGINTNSPDQSSILDIVSENNNAGILIPRINEEQRNSISSPANGLMIFNTTENCINSYDIVSSSWNSLCGGASKATLSADCSNVMVYGTYSAGTPLNNSNYLTIEVNVIKAGAYTITATTTNGYGFTSSGTFLSKGKQKVTLPGQGIPVNVSPADEVSIDINGVPSYYTCTSNPVTIQVNESKPTYTMTCSSITVNGTYTKGVSLKAGNTISLQVNVTDVGNGLWSINTNTVDGILFSGNGTFTNTGPQNVVLSGKGIPTTPDNKTMTITSNSTGESVESCSASINMVYSSKTMYLMGYAEANGGPSNGAYGYIASSRAAYNMVMANANFGTSSDSKVKIKGGFNLATIPSVTLPAATTANPTDSQLQTALATKPDIVLIGWGFSYSTAAITSLIDYLNDGGVLIILNKFASTGKATSGEASFFSSLFGTTVTASNITNISGIANTNGSSVGSIIPLKTISGDPILSGPFGDLNGMQWGNDYFPATVLNGIPESSVTIYSDANVKGGSGQTGVTMFKHKSLNLFWVGDGGFLSNEYQGGIYSNNNIEPFATVSATDFTPTAKTNFGSSTSYGGTGEDVYNSQLFGNILAWAIKQAEINGINSN